MRTLNSIINFTSQIKSSETEKVMMEELHEAYERVVKDLWNWQNFENKRIFYDSGQGTMDSPNAIEITWPPMSILFIDFNT